jgi:hypothetical protein
VVASFSRQQAVLLHAFREEVRRLQATNSVPEAAQGVITDLSELGMVGEVAGSNMYEIHRPAEAQSPYLVVPGKWVRDNMVEVLFQPEGMETSGDPSIYVQAFINLISNPDILSKLRDEVLYSPPQQAQPEEEAMKKEPNKYIASLSRKKRVTVTDIKEDTARLLAQINEVRKGIVSARKRLSGNQPR